MLQLRRVLFLALILAAGATTALVSQVPTPASVIGWEPGEDRKLADYTQLLEYYQRLAAASPRVELVEIGRTTQGRPMILLFISSEENLRQLERWRGISRRLALARDLDEQEARRLAREGKAIVWIDAGLHSTEVAHAQHVPQLAHHMATDESEESRRIREDVILLLMPQLNPDGHEIVVQWYRDQLGTPYETTRPPTLYNEYADHDNNRDWFMLTQQESQVVARVLYEQWFPQIVFNHHQTGPFPARITIPPFAEPLNPHISPRVVRGVNLVGTHMAQRFENEGMPGVVSRMQYDMWWNGGMRSAPYFHNQIGILVEVQHNSATPRYTDPAELPLTFGSRDQTISAREPSIFYPNPWRGGWARIADAMRYHFVASLATLDVAQKNREDWLYGIYQTGREAIAAGTEGGPFAYVVALEEQWDAGEAVELLNVLRRGGVEVHRATGAFEAGGRRYPAGSYIVHAGQAFRAHVMDLMEPQVYPERRLYEGGPPEPPYDLAGWTLPIQMGVTVDRVEAPFRAASRLVERVEAPTGRVSGSGTFGYLLSPRRNASVQAVTSLLQRGERVSRAGSGFTVGREGHDPGTFVVHAGPATRGRLEELARELGLEATGVASRPAAPLRELRLPRIGLYRSWVVEIDEGWIRWVLDQYGIPYTNLRDAELRAGDLSGYDVIVLPAQPASAILGGHAAGSMPERYVGGVGGEGAAALRRFVEGGGRLVAIDGATDFVMEQFRLPVTNALAGLSTNEFFIPGSLLRMTVATEHPLAQGVPGEVSGSFVTRRGSQSRAFAIAPGAEGSVEVVTRWAPDRLLLSGWALGEQEQLAGRPSMVRVGLGSGDVVLLGFRPQFRGQPRGTYKFLFNPMLRLDGQEPTEQRTPVGAAAQGGGWSVPGEPSSPW